MSNQNKIRLVFIFFGLTILMTTAFLFISNQSQTQQNKTSPSAPSKNDINIIIRTAKGDVNIKNIYKNPLQHLSANGVAFADNSDYYMAYYPEDQGFLIVIQNKDIQFSRQKAEADFLTILEISKDDACKLKVSLTVPFDVDENASGGNYHLSFCPNGTVFPK
jgi:hypothetical protein